MTNMLIDGVLRGAADGRSYENINPATEAVVGVAPDASWTDLDEAIGAARRTFDQTTWSTDHEFRARCLEQLRVALNDERETLRSVMVEEGGIPIGLTYSIWLDAVIDSVRYWSGVATSFHWEQDLGVGETFLGPGHRMIFREPIGVVGAITPWNFPFPLNLFKVAGALAAGCTVILKPAPDTPWCGTELGRIIAERTDIPDGVVNVVSASVPDIGAAMISDPRIDMVTFTGSTATGKKIMASAAETLKRLCLELGGKSANIILEDADFASTVGAAAGVCAHAGQGCALTTRLLVPRSRYDEAIEIAVASFESLACGDPTDPSVIVGPLINSRQRDRVLGLIEHGKSEARLLVGGGKPSSMSKGYYVVPTLFADVDPGARIAQEEIFGPVLAIIPYAGDDDAVRIANDSMYGLSGAVHGGDLDRALSVARRVRTGTIGVNGGAWFGPDLPFGGYKQSGLGREFGMEGFAEFLETKTIGLPA